MRYAQVFFVCAAFSLLVMIGSFSVSNVIQKSSLRTVSVALNETERTIRAYLREPVIAFDNIYTAVTDMLDKGESQQAVLSYLTQTADNTLSQEDGITGFIAVYGYIRGEFLSGVTTDLGDDFIPQQRPWYQIAIRSQGSEYTAPYSDVNSGLTVISLAQELYGVDDDYYGVLSIDIDISWLTDYAQALQFSEGGYGMIVNQFLYTLAHPSEELTNIPLQELGGGYNKIADMLRTNREVSAVSIRDTDNTPVIVYYKHLYNGWYVGVVMPTASYYADLYTTILLLVALGVILAAILSYILLRLSSARLKADEENRHKSSFLATMSHELRTPMNAVIGIAQIQMQKPDISDDNKAAFEKIYHSGSDLLGIINDILDMSKIETGKLELIEAPYNTPSLINDAAQLNIVRIGAKPIDFILEIDHSLPSVMYGDELRLKQILNNLLSNAIKYTQKGSVKLTVKHTALDEEITLIFIVEDTGQGMKPEDMEQLFAAYQRFNKAANRYTEGTGIGLSITKSLVEIMGGTIDVKSEYGKGSTFTVTVKQRPVDNSPIGQETSARLSGFSYTEQKQPQDINVVHEEMQYGKVLIVDDVDINLYVAEGLLSPYGLSIDKALSGFEAIEMVNSGAVYDIIFMDHMMPKMDGIETTRKLREQGYKGAIVALTANALVGNEKMFKENGFNEFLSKPMDTRHLDEILERYIRDRHPDKINGITT